MVLPKARERFCCTLNDPCQAHGSSVCLGQTTTIVPRRRLRNPGRHGGAGPSSGPAPICSRTANRSARSPVVEPQAVHRRASILTPGAAASPRRGRRVVDRWTRTLMLALVGSVVTARTVTSREREAGRPMVQRRQHGRTTRELQRHLGRLRRQRGVQPPPPPPSFGQPFGRGAANPVAGPVSPRHRGAAVHHRSSHRGSRTARRDPYGPYRAPLHRAAPVLRRGNPVAVTLAVPAKVADMKRYVDRGIDCMMKRRQRATRWRRRHLPRVQPPCAVQRRTAERERRGGGPQAGLTAYRVAGRVLHPWPSTPSSPNRPGPGVTPRSSRTRTPWTIMPATARRSRTSTGTHASEEREPEALQHLGRGQGQGCLSGPCGPAVLPTLRLPTVGDRDRHRAAARLP